MTNQTPRIEISLTDFVDFVCKVGSAKLNLVKRIKNRKEYSPLTDFYKGLREGIVSNQKLNGDKDKLDDIMKLITDTKKVNNYKEGIKGYKKFLAKKSILWFDPPFKHWTVGDLDVRVNPELGLKYDGKFFVVKLYFKNDKLSKDKITHILTLMENQLAPNDGKEFKMGILDVRISKLFTKDDDGISMLPLLDGEAKSFEAIWKGI